MTQSPKPVALIILDGWGHSETSKSNAIKAAKTPTWDKLWQDSPHTLIAASGEEVGLPKGQMGNSEVGHMAMGAGRVIYQNLTRITRDIDNKDFFANPTICSAVDKAVNGGKKIHIFGLLSPGGVHSHEDHIHAMVEMAAQRGSTSVYMHAFLDGRDTPPRSAHGSLEKLSEKFSHLKCGRIASIIGRYFAMDRDNRWDRVEKAYNMLTRGEAEFSAESAAEGLEHAYARGENDEFVQATLVNGGQENAAIIEDGDVVICMNFRADRAREITRAFVDPEFTGFNRKTVPALADYVMLTEYAADIDTACAYPKETLPNTLGEYLETLGKTQLRIAETEKYAHVTFFFSGGREATYIGEDRILIPSPDVATYDLKPEMSAPEITDRLVSVIEQQQYDVIICNFANGDMVGHTGIFDAAVKAVETLDACLLRIITALHNVGGECIITADHGNVEQMNDHHSGEAHTAHTSELVPFVYFNQRDCMIENRAGGLADIAPTLLYLMGVPQPEEMTGESLVRFV
jgi:2,3-bisphosphoglycerate-independent phosphoglycerate mutase